MRRPVHQSSFPGLEPSCGELSGGGAGVEKVGEVMRGLIL